MVIMYFVKNGFFSEYMIFDWPLSYNVSHLTWSPAGPFNSHGRVAGSLTASLFITRFTFNVNPSAGVNLLINSFIAIGEASIMIFTVWPVASMPKRRANTFTGIDGGLLSASSRTSSVVTVYLYCLYSPPSSIPCAVRICPSLKSPISNPLKSYLVGFSEAINILRTVSISSLTSTFAPFKLKMATFVRVTGIPLTFKLTGRPKNRSLMPGDNANSFLNSLDRSCHASDALKWVPT